MAPNLPSSPELNKDPGAGITEDRGKDLEIKGQYDNGACSDYSATQDFGCGIMKIVPSDADVSLRSLV